MKKLLIAALLITNTIAFAADPTPVHFKNQKFSFGKINKGTPVSTKFDFTNISAKPVVIELATAECGCTTPEYPKTPILQGKSATIKVTYNAANAGHFQKKVTVKLANFTEPIVLEIEGDVAEK